MLRSTSEIIWEKVKFEKSNRSRYSLCPQSSCIRALLAYSRTHALRTSSTVSHSQARCSTRRSPQGGKDIWEQTCAHASLETHTSAVALHDLKFLHRGLAEVRSWQGPALQDSHRNLGGTGEPHTVVHSAVVITRGLVIMLLGSRPWVWVGEDHV